MSGHTKGGRTILPQSGYMLAWLYSDRQDLTVPPGGRSADGVTGSEPRNGNGDPKSNSAI